MGGGLAPSSQTVGSLLRTPWLAQPARLMYSANSNLKIMIPPKNLGFILKVSVAMVYSLQNVCDFL
jgi:hypothetical protein